MKGSRTYTSNIIAEQNRMGYDEIECNRNKDKGKMSYLLFLTVKVNPFIQSELQISESMNILISNNTLKK